MEESRESIQMMKKWYGIMEDMCARPMIWMPIPESICWSEKERRSLRGILEAERGRRTMVVERRRAVEAVMMKERRT